MQEIKIERVPFDQMNPATYNPRADLQPGDPEYDALKQSIETYGCVEPIVWNRQTGNIVGGHQRFKVMQDLGYTEDNVSVVDLDDTQEKALNLALNKVSGRWDNDKLAVILEELQAASVEAIGFSAEEIDRVLENAHLDIDSFFNDAAPAGDAEDEPHGEDEIQCPHCHKWFKPE